MRRSARLLKKYIFSACTTLLCACAVAAGGDVGSKLPLMAGLLVSVAADWLLAHQKEGGNRFLYGVIGFFFAHLMFAWYAFERFAFSRGALIACLILLAGYIVYMALRMLPRGGKGAEAAADAVHAGEPAEPVLRPFHGRGPA